MKLLLNLYSQFQFIVQRGSSGKGFVAIDEVDFRAFEVCEFSPPEAKPVPTTVAPTTQPPTTTIPTTTIEPTEPPDCK